MSKKYRLIKEYPGSPKLGTMGEVINNTVMYTETDNDMPYYSIGYIDFKRHPEYWEEIVEKDYQILSFKQNSLVKDLWTEFAHGWCKNSNGNPITYPYSYDDILNNHLSGGIEYRIHSVKRLSDGEVFTVGDKIKGYDNDNGFIISHIWIGSSNDLVLANYPKNAKGFNRSCFIKGAIKVKTPLLTTEDGVEIYQNSELWWVAVNEDKEVHSSDETWSYGKFKWIGSISDSKNYKWFSTKEKAEEYVLMNKPCLSINEVMNITYNPTETFTSTTNKLKELVKSKI